MLGYERITRLRRCGEYDYWRRQGASHEDAAARTQKVMKEYDANREGTL